MKVDTDSLVKHFGASIGKTGSEGKRKQNRVNCPLHQDLDESMMVVEDATTGDTMFICSHPGCRFRGDAVALVATKLGISPRNAVQLFRPGGEFADCLKEPLGTDEAGAYAENADTQQHVRAYLSKCKAALRRCPEKARVRAGMSVSSLKLLHPDVGLFIADDAPRCLSEFRKPKYNKSTLLLYPYTCNGTVTRIEVRDYDNPLFSYSAVVTSPTAGVFGEMFENTPKHVIVTNDPYVATVVYANYAVMSGKPAPIVAASSFPLPGSFSETTRIRILSPHSRPVPIGFVLDMLSASELVSGTHAEARIVPFQKRVDEITKDVLDNIISCANGTTDPQYWVVQRFIEMVKRGQSAAVVEELERAKVSPLVRNIILDQARKFDTGSVGTNSESEYARALVDLLDGESSAAPFSDSRLANGMTLVREPSGLSVSSPYGGTDVICNVGIVVDSKTVASDGTEQYRCTVTHRDPGIPVVRIQVPSDRVSADRLRRIVSKAYMAKGCNPYVAFYSVKNASWPDVLSKLSEHCPVSKEVQSLGVDDLSELQLPEVAIRSDGTPRAQTKANTLPECVLRAYGGIPFDTDSGVEPFVRLFQSCDNLYVMAFALGVCHVLYQMTFGIFKPEASRRREPRHFFYVETEPGIWGAVFRQVSDLFSDNGSPPTVNCQNPLSTFESYAKLGTLPLITYAPTLGNRFSSALDESGIDILALVDTTTAVMTNGKVSAVYVTPSNEAPMSRCAIDGRDIDAMRRSIVPLLSRFVAEARIDSAFRASSSPCIAAYNECCRMLGVERSPLASEIARTYFPGVGMNGATIFFDMLHRSVVDDSKPAVCVVNGAPQKGYSFTRRGQHVFVMKECVVVSHMVADIYNQWQKGLCRFDTDQLTSEMEATGVLCGLPPELGLDGSRCWCLRRDVWESAIVRPPINLNDPVSAGTIPLKPLEPSE